MEGNSRFYVNFLIIAVVFVIALVVLAFALPKTYSWSENCSNCQGKATVVCTTCRGSGVCWICGGTGKISYMNDEYCMACQGSGKCYACEGSGVQTCPTCLGNRVLTNWKHTLSGAAVVISVFSVLVFMGGFGLGYINSEVHLSFNEWIYEVDSMEPWFNPGSMTWLFAKDRRRWARWQTVTNTTVALCWVVLLFAAFSLRVAMPDIIIWGSTVAIIVTSLFSFIFYKAYAS